MTRHSYLKGSVVLCSERTEAPSSDPLPSSDSLLDLSLDAFIKGCNEASVRLHNGLRYAASEGVLPYPSVKAYLQAGPERIDALKKLPLLGTKSVNEFDRLATDAALAPAIAFDQHAAHRVGERGADIVQPDNFYISLFDFVARQPRVSVRLWRILQTAVEDGSCPYATVEDYLRDGPKRVAALRALPSLGSTSAREFEELVQTALLRKDAAQPVTLPEGFNVSLAGFLARQPVVSARLWRVIHAVCDAGDCPFPSVAAYVRAGAQRVDTLRALPSLGSRSADEFEEMVHAALQRGSVEPTTFVAMQANGFPDLEVVLNGVLNSLDERVSNLLLDRLQAGVRLESIAQTMGVSRARVQQIETKAIGRLATKFGPILRESFSAIERQCRERAIRECTLHELAALAGCDVITCDMFFRLIDKLKLDVPKSFLLCDGLYLIRPDEFAPEDTWDETIKRALVHSHWPLVLADFIALLPELPRHYVEKRLCERYRAVIVEGAFTTLPRLSKRSMCLQVMTKAKKPLHLTEIRAGMFKHFGVDLSLSHVTSTVGSHDQITPCGPGTYVRYADLPYSETLIEGICNAVHNELLQRQVFLSIKVVFDRLFADDVAYYPGGFNHYLLLGFCQDDPRFVSKRGDMIGLAEFDVATVFISLEDEVRGIVFEHGPIDIPAILGHLADTRKLCNDSGVRQILANSPEVIQVGRRTYNSLHRFFARREEYDELVLAIRVVLLERAKSLYAVSSEVAALGLHKASSEVVGSILAADEDVDLRDGIYHLTPSDAVLQRYALLAQTCHADGNRERLCRLAAAAFGDETADRLIRYDRRFHDTAQTAPTHDTGTELQSLLADFDF